MPARKISEPWTLAGLTTREQTILVQVLKALRQVRYGSITIIVQDSRVVQIDYTEKIRLGKEMEQAPDRGNGEAPGFNPPART
ncbi:hypothetical protein MTBGP_22690 [Moorella thermoacetica]|uniref:YezD family protein n=1 Tax=Neomoorella thermoacetica TaxID=1525 RepID=UPI0030CDDC9E